MFMPSTFKCAIAASFVSLASAKLTGCAKTFALTITNIYENGDTSFHYDYCENLHDGRGITAGIAGFCTGTGDAWQVVQQYHKLTGGNDAFSSMDKALAKYAENSSDSTKGLGKFCKVWGKLGTTDSRFKHAQDMLRDQLYFDPSQKLADDAGLKLSISQAQMYDTGIEHGTWPDKDGLPTLINETSASFTSDASGDSGSTLNINGHQVDEIVWLKKFISVREDHLIHPREPENQGGNYWAQTIYRTKSYTYAINKREYVWSNAVTILDNDGKPVLLTCASADSCPSNGRRRRR
ncbi:lysozyme-like domain-containing protein [Coemansia spiralis]|nr:lysozyme-like domain-containing protein [Coemansia spiralis]